MISLKQKSADNSLAVVEEVVITKLSSYYD